MTWLQIVNNYSETAAVFEVILGSINWNRDVVSTYLTRVEIKAFSLLKMLKTHEIVFFLLPILLISVYVNKCFQLLVEFIVPKFSWFLTVIVIQMQQRIYQFQLNHSTFIWTLNQLPYVVSRMPLIPKNVHSLIPGTWECVHLHGKRGFTNIIKIINCKIDYYGLSK